MADPISRGGRTYASPEICGYVDRVHAPHDAPLQAAFDAPAVEGMPAIQVGPSEGKLVGLLTLLSGAERVVEVGTLAGYSAIRIARAMPRGQLWTIESEPRHAAVARARIAEAGLAARVEVLEGDALNVLPTLARKGPFGLVFLDADKGRYDRYGRWAYEHLAPGGLLVADNAYFFGRLLDADSPDAAAMRRFHEEASVHLDTVCIPTPDGLLVGRRPA